MRSFVFRFRKSGCLPPLYPGHLESVGFANNRRLAELDFGSPVSCLFGGLCTLLLQLSLPFWVASYCLDLTWPRMHCLNKSVSCPWSFPWCLDKLISDKVTMTRYSFFLASLNLIFIETCIWDWWRREKDGDLEHFLSIFYISCPYDQSDSR